MTPVIKDVLISLQKRFFRFVRKDFLEIIVSLVIAVAVWFLVSITIFPTTITTITGIPFQEISLEGTPAGDAQLSVVSAQIPESVSVQIEGKRVEIGSLQASRMTARAVISGDITKPGIYDLKIVVASLDGISFSAKGISPSSCKVEFDKTNTVQKPVRVNAVNISAAEGFTYDSSNIKVDPETVTITGPESRVNSIEYIEVQLDGNNSELNATTTFISADFVVKAMADGALTELDIESNKLEIETTSFSVTIPIMRDKELDVAVKYQNAPASFDPRSLEAVQEISADSITFASPDISVDRYSEFPLYIDVRQISPENNVFEFDVAEIAESLGMEDFVNISKTNKITVTYNMDSYTEKTFSNLENISIINTPADYKVLRASGGLTLTFVGPSAQLEGENALTASDISMVIDLSKATVSSGKFTAEVIVSAPNFGGVWVSSKPMVTLRGEQLKPE